MTRIDDESFGHALLTSDAEVSTGTTCCLVSEEPPNYSVEDCSNASTEPPPSPPPPYTVPEEHPPPYQAPQRTVASHHVRYSPAQSDRLNIALVTSDLRQRVRSQSSTTSYISIILACTVFWMCGFVFGSVAYILAKMSQRIPRSQRDQKMNVYLTRASIIVSLMGVAFGAAVLTIVLSIARTFSPGNCCAPISTAQLLTTTPSSVNDTTSPPLKCAFELNDICYRYSSSYNRIDCDNLNGTVGVDSVTQRYVCYHNRCDDYVVRMKCFRHRSALLSYLECLGLNGYYEVAVSGTSCYYNMCPGYYTKNNQCYKTRQVSSRARCVDGYYEDGFCYVT